VLVLALLGVLTTLTGAPGPVVAGLPADPDTSLLVAGTALRFGLADSVVAARGFTPAESGDRQGPCRFFGLDSDARLGFTHGRLDRAEFTIAEIAPHQRDYVQDQLTAMGYRRGGQRLGERAGECDWQGAVRVQLTVDGTQLKALVTPPPPPPPPPVPVLPGTLHVREPGRPGHRGEAVLLEAPACTAPAALRPDGAPPRVRVRLLVDTDGSVLEATVIRGLPTLDTPALDCARRWRFEPRNWQGAPCRFWVEAPVTVGLD